MNPQGSRAHVLNDPRVSGSDTFDIKLCLGEKFILNTPYAEGAIATIVLARYHETAKRINAELDSTGHMNLFRASEIAHDVIMEHWRDLDSERNAVLAIVLSPTISTGRDGRRRFPTPRSHGVKT